METAQGKYCLSNLVNLVSDHHFNEVAPGGVRLQLVQPHLELDERPVTADVVYEYSTLRVPVVRGRQRSEPLLSRRVPYRQLDSVAVHAEPLGLEVDADCQRLLRVKVVFGETKQQTENNLGVAGKHLTLNCTFVLPRFPYTTLSNYKQFEGCEYVIVHFGTGYPNSKLTTPKIYLTTTHKTQ